jgi:hypothetical protein
LIRDGIGALGDVHVDRNEHVRNWLSGRSPQSRAPADRYGVRRVLRDEAAATGTQ